jgi:hypothetical protein
MEPKFFNGVGNIKTTVQLLVHRKILGDFGNLVYPGVYLVGKTFKLFDFSIFDL